MEKYRGGMGREGGGGRVDKDGGERVTKSKREREGGGGGQTRERGLRAGLAFSL